MEISIVIPVYNCEDFLERCLDSVQAQTLSDWELWLIDDGSEDQGGAICRRYEEIDRRIHYLSKKHEGQGPARNLGVRMARGKYIAFLDADDWWREDALARLYETAEKESCDLVFCDHYNVEGDSQSPVYRLARLPIRLDKPVCLAQRPELLFRLEGAVWDKLYRRELWNEIRQSSHFYEDSAVLPFVLERAGRIGQVQEPLVYYWSIRKDSTVNRSDTVFDIQKCLEEIRDGFSRNGSFYEYRNELRKYSRWLYLVAFNHIQRTSSGADGKRYQVFLSGCLSYIQAQYPVQERLDQMSIAVWGSYNLRSQVNRSRENIHPVEVHYSFSSLISLMGPRAPFRKEYVHSGAYRNQMLRQDLNQDFRRLKKLRNISFLCIDLLEERFPLAMVEENVVTASDALLEAAGGEAVKVLPMDERARFQLWQKSALAFISFLRSNFLEKQIILVENYLNEYSGIYLKEKLFADAEEIRRQNQYLKKCYDFLEASYPGIHIIRNQKPELEYSDEFFPHGCYPWHQNEYLYYEIAGQLEQYLLLFAADGEKTE